MATSTPCAPSTCCRYYKVASGDSCDSIASVEDVIESKIEQWNPGQCGNNLQIGVELCINGPDLGSAPPFGSCASSTCFSYEVVRKNETCSGIATRKGIPESTLQLWNPGSCGPDLQVGAKLCVEGPAAALGYTASTRVSSSTISSNSGFSITGSSSFAQVTNGSKKMQVSRGNSESLAVLIIGMAVYM